MKRFIAILLSVLLLAMLLSGCRKTTESPVANPKISIVCTIFPQYDWMRQIIGDNARNIELIQLLDSRIDLHNYQPSVEDIAKISACDLFVYVGGESDEWVDDVLKETTNKDMVTINLLDVLGDAAKTEEVTEGMEGHDHAHEDSEDYDHAHEGMENYDHAYEDGEGHNHENEYDEHVWLSLKNAQIFCVAIAEALSTIDAGHKDTYQSNLTAYTEKLSALDTEYQAMVDASLVKTLLFGDRFPFRYLTDDYGLGYYAAFAGCSAETEASFETVVFLAQKTDALGLNTILVTESSDKSIAKTIRDNTASKSQQILVLDSMQTASSKDTQNGVTYLSVMENNLSVLKDALQ